MAGEERRHYPRHRVHFEIQVSPIDSPASFEETVLLRDISDGGLSFITKMPGLYRVDQKLTISLHHSSAHVARDLEGTATVRWLKHCDHSMNQAFVGVQLDELIESSSYIPG